MCRLSWSGRKGATIIAHPRERPGIVMTMIILTCFIPGSVLDILDILPSLIITKHICVVLFYFTDERIEAYRGLILSLGVLGFTEKA